MAEPYASTGCSDLSIDILILMVQLVELPVCPPCMTLFLYLGRHGCPTSLHAMAHVVGDRRRTIFLEANKVYVLIMDDSWLRRSCFSSHVCNFSLANGRRRP
jgi:hypothetical protein